MENDGGSAAGRAGDYIFAAVLAQRAHAFEETAQANCRVDTLIVGELSTPAHKKADPQLIVLLQDAHRAQTLAFSKPNLSLEQLARTFGRSSERFKRLLRLSYLSPKFIEAVVEGRQPGRVTNRFLQNLDRIPLSWVAQEDLLLR